MNNAIIEDFKRLPQLFIGFIFLSIGIILILKSDLGNPPWSVFHIGLSNRLENISFGEITQILGFIILIFSVVFLKTKIGIGTILNALLVGFIIDFFNEVIFIIPETIFLKSLVFTFGLLFMTFGRSLYISSKLGAGPRDGVFVGLSRVTQIDVKYIKPAIELTILLIGYLLGGPVGIGTLIAVLISGYLVQFFFTILGFNPKIVNQRNFREYFIKTT